MLESDFHIFKTFLSKGAPIEPHESVNSFYGSNKALKTIALTSNLLSIIENKIVSQY